MIRLKLILEGNHMMIDTLHTYVFLPLLYFFFIAFLYPNIEFLQSINTYDIVKMSHFSYCLSIYYNKIIFLIKKLKYFQGFYCYLIKFNTNFCKIISLFVQYRV